MKKKQKKNSKLWVLIFILNGGLIYLVAVLFPDLIVLGNASLSNWLGAIVTSLLLTAVLTQIEPIIKALKIKIANDLYWGFLFGVVNIMGLWLIARIAEWTGFGIASVYVAVVLGFVLNLVQYGAYLLLGIKSK